MGRPSWCDTCRPTGVRCAPCEARRVRHNTYRMRSYERLKQDPVALDLHRQRSRDGMNELKADRWARGLTYTGRPRVAPTPAAYVPAIEEKIMAIYTIPRCENCPTIGRACPKCRSAHRRAKHLEEVGELKRKPIPRCPKCPPVGGPCRPCRSAYEKARHAERMADPEYAAKRQAQQAEADRRRAEKLAAAGIVRKRNSAPKPKPEGWAPKQAGRKPTLPRCPNCPPKGLQCPPCRSAHRASLRAGRGPSEAAQRLADALASARTQAEASAIKREMTLPAGKKPIPRCENCPEVGKPCRECYNRYKRGGAEPQKGGRRPSAASDKPKITRTEREVVLAVPAAPAREERRWSLDTCAVCMAKGRWGGLNACPRHTGQVAPPAEWAAAQKTYGYRDEYNAAKKGGAA